MASISPHTVNQLRIIAQCHTPFARGDDFDGVKAEDGDVAVAAVANRFTFVFATNGVGGVFYYLEAVAMRQGVDGSHVAGLAAQVDGDDDFGQLAFALGLLQLVGQGLRAEVVGARVNVNKIYLRAAVQAAVGTGNKGDGAGPEPVAIYGFLWCAMAM